MELTLPISEIRFYIYLQIYMTKLAKYETYNQLREREFARISEFRPLPELSLESIPTDEVPEPVRIYTKDLVEKEVTVVERTSFDDVFSKLTSGVSAFSEQREEEEVQEFMETVPTIFGSAQIADSEDEELFDDFNDDDSDEDFDDDSDEDFDDDSDEDFDDDSDEDFDDDSDEDSNFEEIQTTSAVEETFTRSEIQNAYFKSTYIPKRPTIKEVVRVSKQVKPEKVVANNVKPVVTSFTQEPMYNETLTTSDNSRFPTEDLIAFTRRNVRVSESEALKYFSPKEIEQALKQGKLLKKRGILIFAHS